MSHNSEQYKPAEGLNLTEAITELRKYIGELPDFRPPTRDEVETAVEENFADMLTNEKAKIVEAFMASEQAAADMADEDFADAA